MNYKGYKLYANQELKIRIEETNEEFSSVDEAKARVDRLVAAKRVAAKVKHGDVPVLTFVKESYKVIAEIGTAVITGVHATQKRLLTKPKFDRYLSPEYYPDVPWIKGALEQVNILNRQVERMRNVLNTYRIDEPGYQFDGTSEKEVEALYAEIERKCKAAAATNLEEQLGEQKK